MHTFIFWVSQPANIGSIGLQEHERCLHTCNDHGADLGSQAYRHNREKLSGIATDAGYTKKY